MSQYNASPLVSQQLVAKQRGVTRQDKMAYIHVAGSRVSGPESHSVVNEPVRGKDARSMVAASEVR